MNIIIMGLGNSDTSEDKESHEEHRLKVIFAPHLRSGEGPVLFVFVSKCHTVSNQIVCSCHHPSPNKMYTCGEPGIFSDVIMT